jgi:hypothetical protein
MTTRRKPPSDPLPTHDDTEALVANTIKDASWLGDLDQIAIGLFVDTYHELRHMTAVFKKYPDKKTPQAVDRYQDLLRQVDRQIDNLGMSPGARRELRLGAGVQSPKPPVTPNRDPEHLKKMARLMAKLGMFGSEAIQYAKMADQVDAIEDTDDQEEDDGESTA